MMACRPELGSSPNKSIVRGGHVELRRSAQEFADFMHVEHIARQKGEASLRWQDSETSAFQRRIAEVSEIVEAHSTSRYRAEAAAHTRKGSPRTQ